MTSVYSIHAASLDSDIHQACIDIRRARHISEENEARARFDKLILMRHELRDRGAPQGRIQHLLWELSKGWAFRVEVGRQCPMTLDRTVIAHTTPWPLVVRFTAREWALAEFDTEPFLFELRRRIGEML